MNKNDRGYVICVTPTGSDLPFVPNVEHIRRSDSSDLPNRAAARKAEKDGIKIIHDMPNVPDWTYIDTPQNREKITAWLKEHPEMCFKRNEPAVSTRYKATLLVPSKDAEMCQELLDMPCDEEHIPAVESGIGKYADVRCFGLTFPNGYTATITVSLDGKGFFVNPVLYNEEMDEVMCLPSESELEGVYTFDYCDNVYVMEVVKDTSTPALHATTIRIPAVVATKYISYMQGESVPNNIIYATNVVIAEYSNKFDNGFTAVLQIIRREAEVVANLALYDANGINVWNMDEDRLLLCVRKFNYGNGTYEVEVTDEPAPSDEKQGYWTEIRHDFHEDSPAGYGDVITAVSVDGWRTPDDNAEGEVIARVFLTKNGDVVIDYINAIARTDVLAQEAISETVQELREQFNSEEGK
jgi:hypothetical protein